MINPEHEILIKHRMNQAAQAISEIDILLENKMLSLAVNRIYYSLFYAISAVSIKDNFSTSKHKNLLGWFNKNYINTGLLPKEYGKLIYACFENREKSDYDFLFELTKEEILKYFDLAKEFVLDIGKIIDDLGNN